MKKIVMGTSIAPFNYEKQTKAIKSWIDNGFKVLSFNCMEEIEILRPYFENMGVEFVEIERDASEISGKKLPYIQDILDGVSQRTEQICGFFNSDIYLENISKEIYDFIYNETMSSVVFTRRNEISEYADIDKMEWTIHFDGLDLFFIDKLLVPDFFDDGFYVQTTWSACFLEKCRIKSIPTKELMNPIAFHKKHSIRWNFEVNNQLVEKFWRRYYGTKEGAFEKALNSYYCDILEFTGKICYCNELEKKCLFLLEEINEETIDSIKSQEGFQITIGTCDEKQEEYDYIVRVKKNVLLDKTFCKLVVYLMEHYDLSNVDMGRFFVSEIGGNAVYNNLNRNLSVVKEINEISNVYTTVHRNDLSNEKRCKVFLPVSYEIINLDEQELIEKKEINGDAYLMPSGVRANEWYEINQYRLKELKVKGFLDNSEDKVGKMLANKQIYPAKNILQSEENICVILASKYYSNEIKKQLLQYVDEKNILDTGYIIQISQDGKFFCFNLQKYRERHL